MGRDQSMKPASLPSGEINAAAYMDAAPKAREMRLKGCEFQSVLVEPDALRGLSSPGRLGQFSEACAPALGAGHLASPRRSASPGIRSGIAKHLPRPEGVWPRQVFCCTCDDAFDVGPCSILTLP